MKPDEMELLDALQRMSTAGASPPYVRGVVSRLSMNENRAAYICGKWTRKGWYDYGVNILAGWLTPLGKEQGGVTS